MLWDISRRWLRWGCPQTFGFWTDSSAAVGICGRSGLGKLRHVQHHTLWFQERVRSGAIEPRKVNGLVNPADLFTKHLTSRHRFNQLIELFNCEYRDGRSAAAPELKKDREPAAVHAVQHEHDPDANNKSPMHDPDILPQMYDAHEMSKTFEIAVAPAELDFAQTGQCTCSRPECRVCFPPPMPEFGPPVTNSEAWIIDKSEILSEKGCKRECGVEATRTLVLSQQSKSFGEVAPSQSLEQCLESQGISGTVRWPRLLGSSQSS